MICTSAIHETNKTLALCSLVILAEKMSHLITRQKIKGVVQQLSSGRVCLEDESLLTFKSDKLCVKFLTFIVEELKLKGRPVAAYMTLFVLYVTK